MVCWLLVICTFLFYEATLELWEVLWSVAEDRVDLDVEDERRVSTVSFHFHYYTLVVSSFNSFQDLVSVLQGSKDVPRMVHLRR